MRKRATVLSATEAARSFSDVIGRVRFRRERFVVTKGGKKVAELIPVEESRSVTLRQLVDALHDVPRLGEREETAFELDIARARTEGEKAGVRDPWESS